MSNDDDEREPRDAEDEDEELEREREREARRRRRNSSIEGMFRDSFRKAVERGLEASIGTLRTTENVVRGVVGEGTLGKELSSYLFTQIDETKNVMIRAVAGEVREFLDQTDISKELQRALTALSFEVRMEIRFIPNDKGELKPEVKSKAVPRAVRKDRERDTDRERDRERERERERRGAPSSRRTEALEEDEDDLDEPSSSGFDDDDG
ncbi:MAG: hypothetical protein U0230_07695 [Polyangiales bacterium]